MVEDVKIKNLYVNKYFSNNEYLNFVKKQVINLETHDFSHKPKNNQSNHPVVCVSQNDVAYANGLVEDFQL